MRPSHVEAANGVSASHYTPLPVLSQNDGRQAEQGFVRPPVNGDGHDGPSAHCVEMPIMSQNAGTETVNEVQLPPRPQHGDRVDPANKTPPINFGSLLGPPRDGGAAPATGTSPFDFGSLLGLSQDGGDAPANEYQSPRSGGLPGPPGEAGEGAVSGLAATEVSPSRFNLEQLSVFDGTVYGYMEEALLPLLPNVCEGNWDGNWDWNAMDRTWEGTRDL